MLIEAPKKKLTRRQLALKFTEHKVRRRDEEHKQEEK